MPRRRRRGEGETMADENGNYKVQCSVSGFDIDGRSVMWNIRGTTPEEFDALLDRYAPRIAKLHGSRAEAEHSRHAESVEPKQPEPATQPTQPNDGNGDLSFRVDILEGQVQNGKASWKAKGGKYSQFGVTVYPEVLKEAGLGIADGQNFAANGDWVAHYVLGNTGKPYKVTKLVKG